MLIPAVVAVWRFWQGTGMQGMKLRRFSCDVWGNAVKCRLRERHLNGHLKPACEIGKGRLQRRIRLHQLRCCTSSLHSTTTTFPTGPVQEERPIFLHACRPPVMTSLEFGLSRTSAVSLTYKLSYRHDWRTAAHAAHPAMEGSEPAMLPRVTRLPAVALLLGLLVPSVL
ncbi:unnamed protein product [Symbiodinium sp. CCMP2592]|nr:unnamed protein product [Symbiodinium sp. CCMP2592]